MDFIEVIRALIILFIHWFGDFVCQSDWMAQNKSKNWKALSIHVTIYSLVWIPFGWKFMLATWICHFITDAITSRINAQLWAEKKVHWFFVSIGFDQFLHFAQLFITFYFLFR